jgi:hypothetical protein
MALGWAARRVVSGVLLAAGGGAAAWAVLAGGGAVGPVLAAAAGGLSLGLGAALLAPPARLQAAPDPLPAAVAHRMSSPLASLKTNLEWLRDALETGRLRATIDEEETHEVLRDAREAAEALRADVRQLRGTTVRPPSSPARSGAL